MFGVARDESPGFYYNTPQATDVRVDWAAAASQGLQIVYLGSNWDRRQPDLFRLLDRARILRIFGPEAAWEPEGSPESYRAYRGSLPFDGLAPQRTYARHGIGLALLHERWWQEDVISNRIFEIVSVGAVAICPEMPWTRKWFGNSVLYFDPADRPADIADQILRHYEFCAAHPKDAQQIGDAARTIFERHFACERLLTHLLDYHEKKTAARLKTRASVVQHPDISVIVRCGGRPVWSVKRAIDSIRGQHLGRFQVILVTYAEIDLSAITSDSAGAIAEFVEVYIPDGGRAQTLFEGIRHATSPYFAVLDDDDFWLSDHIEELFRAGRVADGENFDIAFSGSVAFDYPIFYRETQFCTRNILLFGFPAVPADVLEVQAAIGTNCFVARRDLLTDEMLEPPGMSTAEDSLLISLLVRRSRPIFSYRATAFYRRGAADGSGWQSDPNRPQDELSLALRAGLAWVPRWMHRGSFERPVLTWQTVTRPALRARKREADGPVQTSDAHEPIGASELVVDSATRMQELEIQVSALLNSTSWRVTLPLRMVRRLLARLTQRGRAE